MKNQHAQTPSLQDTFSCAKTKLTDHDARQTERAIDAYIVSTVKNALDREARNIAARMDKLNNARSRADKTIATSTEKLDHSLAEYEDARKRMIRTLPLTVPAAIVTGAVSLLASIPGGMITAVPEVLPKAGKLGFEKTLKALTPKGKKDYLTASTSLKYAQQEYKTAVSVHMEAYEALKKNDIAALEQNHRFLTRQMLLIKTPADVESLRKQVESGHLALSAETVKALNTTREEAKSALEQNRRKATAKPAGPHMSA